MDLAKTLRQLETKLQRQRAAVQLTEDQIRAFTQLQLGLEQEANAPRTPPDTTPPRRR